MKRTVLPFFLLLLCLFSACSTTALPESSSVPAASVPETVPATVCTETVTLPPEPETSLAPVEPVMLLADMDQTILLTLGMAERGDAECTECIALVMRTVLNRVEADGFGKNIRSVVFAENQFTPVADGSYYSAQPNERCYEALEMVMHGWDESQGALFYEWCEEESWHSQNLELLFQHCDVRFYK